MTKSTTGYTSKPLGPGADRFMLQPYSRYTNASRFAGETDGLEAIESVAQGLPDRPQPHRHGRVFDGRRRRHGPSSCTTPIAGRPARRVPVSPRPRCFFAAALIRQPQNAVQQTLWHMYDSTDYAVNTFNVPVVAYSGGIDAQKQAADAMAAAMLQEGLTLEHVIGPETGHSYEPGARQQVQDRLDAGRGQGPERRSERDSIHDLDAALQQDVLADGRRDGGGTGSAPASTRRSRRTKRDPAHDRERHARCTSRSTPGLAPFAAGTKADAADRRRVGCVAGRRPRQLSIGRPGQGGAPGGDWRAARRHSPQASRAARPDRRCVHGRLRVRAAERDSRCRRRWESGQHEQADYAVSEWVHFFRGEPRVKRDVEVTAADIAAHNLVLFGDPSSNAIYKRIEARLPIRWSASGVVAGSETYSKDHAPVFIFPNPLNPKKYVVINSGFTFHDQSNNDMQSPKLPDWAIVDTTKPGNNYRYLPLYVESQGFFDEAWKLKGPMKP